MHIGRHIVQELVLEFGEPTIERWEAPLTETEFRNIVRHREHGRAHDVSLLILKAGDAAVIRKAGYPEGAFRIPSGGVHPEESFVDGALREAYEETGLSVAIKDYLLQIHATFTLGDERAPWTTHVMLARPLGGAAETLKIEPHDHDEIEAARWMDFSELVDEVSPLLEESGLGGLRYRARIHRRLSELDERIGMRAAAS
jgi:8-oxo-dGTP pyrophosphatase MutT (NUDIX family)